MKKNKLLTIDRYTRDRINANLLDGNASSLSLTGLEAPEFNGLPIEADLTSFNAKLVPIKDREGNELKTSDLKGLDLNTLGGSSGGMMGTITKGIHQIGGVVTDLSGKLSKIKSPDKIFTDIGGYSTASNMYDAGGWMQLAGDSVKHVSTMIGDINKPKQTYNVLKDNIQANTKTGVAASNTDLLLAAYNTFNPMQRVKLKDMWQGWGATTGKALGLGLEGSASGLQAGGPIGAIIGGIMGSATALIGGGVQRRKAKKYTNLANGLISSVNNRNLNILDTKANSLDEANMNRSLATLSAYGGPINGAMDYDLQNKYLSNLELKANSNVKLSSLPNSWSNYGQLLYPENSFDFGGNLSTHGGDFSTGYSYIGAGGTHEENPNLGVPMGFDSQGTPNLVEEGEVVWDDYVFSRRLTVPKEERKKLGLSNKKDLTYADAVSLIAKESDERPNDPYSELALNVSLTRLKASQEESRLKKQDADLEAQLQLLQEQMANMSPLELALMLQQLQLNALLQEDKLLQQEQQQAEEDQAQQQELEQLASPEEQQLMMTNMQQMIPGMAAYGGNLFALGGDEDNTEITAPVIKYHDAKTLGISDKVYSLLSENEKEGLSDWYDLNNAEYREKIKGNLNKQTISYLLGLNWGLKGELLNEVVVLQEPITLNKIKRTAATDYSVIPFLTTTEEKNVPVLTGEELPYVANSLGLYPILGNAPIYRNDAGQYYLVPSFTEGLNSLYSAKDLATLLTNYNNDRYNFKLLEAKAPLLPPEEVNFPSFPEYLSTHAVGKDFEVAPFKYLGTEPFNTTTPQEELPEEEKVKKEKVFRKVPLPELNTTMLRYAPAIDNGILMLTDALGITNKFEGTQGKALRSAINRLRDVEAPAVGTKLGYTPNDRWEAVNNLNALYAAQRAGLANQGNRVSTTAARLLNALTLNEELGKLLASINDSNQTKLERIVAANNALDLANAQRADAANTANAAQDKNRVDLLEKAAAADDAETTLLSKAKNENRKGFFDTLGNIGAEDTYRNWINNTPALYYALHDYGVNYKGEDKTKKKKNGGYLTIKNKKRR